MNKWIKCSERMPPAEQKVLVAGYGSSKFITTAMYEDGTVKVNESKWEWGEDCNYDYRKEPESDTIPEGWIEVPEYIEEYEYYKFICDTVVYWMPLPPLPPEANACENCKLFESCRGVMQSGTNCFVKSPEVK